MQLAHVLHNILSRVFGAFRFQLEFQTTQVDLIKRSQHFVDGGLVPSHNALMIAALEHYITALERQEIDRQFEAMADDHVYLEMNKQMAESFSESDWDALVTGDTE